jgi:prevent-host-death family protein
MTILTKIVISGWEHPSVSDWSVAAAKARLSEVIDRARSEGPQTITRRGRHAAVVVSAEWWQRKAQRDGNLAEFFGRSPLRRSKLKVRRVPGGLRDPDL